MRATPPTEGKMAPVDLPAPLPALPHRTSAAAAATRPSARDEGVPLQLRLMHRVEQAVIIFSLLLQLALYCRSATTLTPLQHLHQALLLLLRGVCLIFTLLPLRTWLKHRSLRILALRLAIATVPSQRGAQSGDAVLLDRPPSSDNGGALRDWLRLLTGTRLLPMALIGSMLIQPPLAVLVQQAALMAVTADNPAFCATRLLTHKLMRRRILVLWRVLEKWAPLVAPLSPAPAVRDLPGPQLRQLQCVATLNWLQGVIGVLLPVLVAGCTAPAQVAPAVAATGAGEGAGGVVEQPDTPCSPRAMLPLKLSVVQRVRCGAAGVCGAARRLDAALQACCLSALATLTGAISMALACCLIAANIYGVARVAAVKRGLGNDK